MSVIAVFNQKGGVGKTTTCLNIIAALDMAKRRPIGLDIDPQGHLTLSAGVKNVSATANMATFFKGESQIDELLVPTPRGWQLAPSSPDLSKVDTFLSNDPKAGRMLRQGLAHSEQAGPGNFVLIDCCPMLSTLTLNALLACDRVLVPMSADYLSLQGVHRLDSALNILESKLKRKLERRVVITRFDGRRRLSFEIADKLKERYGELVCQTKIRECVSLAGSPMQGKDIFQFASNSNGAADYLALTKELGRDGFFG